MFCYSTYLLAADSYLKYYYPSRVLFRLLGGGKVPLSYRGWVFVFCVGVCFSSRAAPSRLKFCWHSVDINRIWVGKVADVNLSISREWRLRSLTPCSFAVLDDNSCCLLRSPSKWDIIKQPHFALVRPNKGALSKRCTAKSEITRLMRWSPDADTANRYLEWAESALLQVSSFSDAYTGNGQSGLSTWQCIQMHARILQ